MSARIVAVSNRVGTPRDTVSVGGLAVGLIAALKETRGLWFGWSGKTSEHLQSAPQMIKSGDLTRALIDLPKRDYDRYYNGFSNRCLWPLMHFRIDLTHYESEDCDAYLRINALFALHLLPLLRDDDLVWVHDYHLFPLGRELRRGGSRHRIGFFLHTPFPPRDVINTLPGHQELIGSMLDYDLIGFQTAQDLRRFCEYVEQELGGVVHEGVVSLGDRQTDVQAFPIGINVDQVKGFAFSGDGDEIVERQLAALQGRTQIIGVDRLDYSKGLLRRTTAYKLLLERHPQVHRKIEFLQIAPLSRSDLEPYRRFGSDLQQGIVEVNDRFSQPEWTPLRMVRRSLPRPTLAALYRASRIGLVTPVRDGMNLVAKEYIAAQDPENPGVLILSCFAGAAQQMKDALLVNPYDTLQMAEAMLTAVNMSLEERQQRHSELIYGLQCDDVVAWRKRYIAQLANRREETLELAATGVP